MNYIDTYRLELERKKASLRSKSIAFRIALARRDKADPEMIQKQAMKIARLCAEIISLEKLLEE